MAISSKILERSFLRFFHLRFLTLRVRQVPWSQRPRFPLPCVLYCRLLLLLLHSAAVILLTCLVLGASHVLGCCGLPLVLLRGASDFVLDLQYFYSAPVSLRLSDVLILREVRDPNSSRATRQLPCHPADYLVFSRPSHVLLRARLVP